MKTSILERKINEDPLTWGSAEMIRTAKKRIKAGLPAFDGTGSASQASGSVTPSKTSASTSKQTSEPVENKNQVASIATSPYPKIRTKYDLLIVNIMESKGASQRDKKIRIKNLELRYEREIQEKKYLKYTLWCLVGFFAIAASLLYAKHSLI